MHTTPNTRFNAHRRSAPSIPAAPFLWPVLRLIVAVLLAVSPAAADPWAALVEHASRYPTDRGTIAPEEAVAAAEFLAAHRPPRDGDIDPRILIDTLDHALSARAEFPWASGVPVDLFHNDVLPYASLDETRENWRPAMYERCRAIVAGASTATEAAQALNRELFNQIDVHYNTGRKAPNQSPAESVAQGRATCTGLSIILVDACRSVGIPARVAGVANWHNKRGNHTWVEIWDDGWHFTGADEYNKKGLDRGWFTGDAGKAIAGSEEFAVWATSWGPTDNHFPMVWNREDTTVHAADVTARYAPRAEREQADDETQTVYLRVFETRDGERVEASILAQSIRGSPVIIRSKAGTTDLNDMPSLAVSRGEPFGLTVIVGTESRSAFIEAMPDATRTVDLLWDELAEPALTRDEAESLVGMVFEARSASVAEDREAEIDANAYTVGDHTLRILEKTFGDPDTPPAGGRSLWISMHGGGGAPAEVNDRQWQNQIKLYQPDEGIYIAPRAPTNTWNLWHRAHIDDLFDRMIETYIATRDVNPNRVYLMGYSAGGDGVYQLAPRMADRFAAAAMMAGHPNETKPLGLRNLPFSLLMGSEDAAYDRNKIAERWGDSLAELRAADPEGYPHTVIIYQGLGHWMERKDAEILPWMASHTRNPWPRKIVWHQDDVTHDRFYWLALEPGDAEPRTTVRASVTGNRIDLDTPPGLNRIRLRLHDRLVDLDKPVTVRVNGARVHGGVVERTRRAVERSLDERNDPASAATAELVLEWSAPPPVPDAPSDP